MGLDRSASPPVFLQPVIESNPVNIEYRRGMALIPSTFFDHPQDVGALHVLEGLARSIGDALRFEDEILFGQLGLLSDKCEAGRWTDFDGSVPALP
jgi:hypothetical protein